MSGAITVRAATPAETAEAVRGGILEQIDGVLSDWENGDDAMSWTAIPSLPRLTDIQMAVARRLAAETGIDGYAAVLMVADAGEQRDSSAHYADVSAVAMVMCAEAFEPLLRRFERQWTAAVKALEPVFAQMGAALAQMGKALASLAPVFAGAERQHGRDLAAMRRDYRRRQLARQRRKR